MSEEELGERLQNIKDYLQTSNLRQSFVAFPPSSPSHPICTQPTEFDLAHCTTLSSSESSEREEMAANNRTLKELAAPDLNQPPLCITFPALDAVTTFELKSGLIHLLPTFHGLAGEDPHKHLKEFHVVCTSMKPTGVTEEQIKLRAFPFSLKDLAKDWLYYLPFGSITTWNEMKKLFLEKYL